MGRRSDLIRLGRDGERPLILQPSAAFRALQPGSLPGWDRGSVLLSRPSRYNFGLCEGRSQISTQGEEVTLSISCHPTEWDRWWEGGSHITSGMPSAASVVI